MREVENNKTDWTRLTQCIGAEFDEVVPCGKWIDVREEDLSFRQRDMMGGFKYNMYGFVCPKCGAFTEIYNLPMDLKNKCKKTGGK